MGSLTLAGLLCQLVSLVLIRTRLGHRWKTYIGAIFVVIACVFHGVGEILIKIFPGEDPYRPLIRNPADLNQFVALAGLAILLFTVAYLILLGPIEVYSDSVATKDLAETSRFLDWRIIALCALPLLILTARGTGYQGVSATNGSVTTATGLSIEFLVILVPLAAFAFVGKHGPKWVLGALVVECSLLALIGQREEIIVGAVCFLYATGRYNIHLGRRALVVGMVVVAGAGLVVTSARANAGRTAFDGGSGVSQKISSLRHGVTGVFDSATRAQLRGDAGYRLDGNSWGALVLERLHEGASPAGPGSIVNDFRDAAPRFLDPTKNNQSPATLSEQTYQGERMGLPRDYDNKLVGVTPTQLGTLLGYWGVAGLLLGAIVMGASFAVVDRWLSTRRTPASLVLGVGLVYCVMFYERSNQTYPVAIRGVLVVLLVVKGIHLIASTAQRSMGGRGPGLPVLTVMGSNK